MACDTTCVAWVGPAGATVGASVAGSTMVAELLAVTAHRKVRAQLGFDRLLSRIFLVAESPETTNS